MPYDPEKSRANTRGEIAKKDREVSERTARAVGRTALQGDKKKK